MNHRGGQDGATFEEEVYRAVLEAGISAEKHVSCPSWVPGHCQKIDLVVTTKNEKKIAVEVKKQGPRNGTANSGKLGTIALNAVAARAAGYTDFWLVTTKQKHLKAWMDALAELDRRGEVKVIFIEDLVNEVRMVGRG